MWQTEYRTVALFVCAYVLLAAPTPRAKAEVSLPAIIGDNMVLQQGKPAIIWGWAEPGEEVLTAVSWAKTQWVVPADANGRWQYQITPPEPGGPYQMTISARNTINIDKIMVGQVWLASGQSNMEFPIGKIGRWQTGVINYRRELKNARYPRIRLFLVKNQVAVDPQEDCNGRWQPCNPDTVRLFSAIAYFFGRELHRELDVPVGLIDSTWGGTPAKAWMSRGALASQPESRQILEEYENRLAKYSRAKKVHREKLQQWKLQVQNFRPKEQQTLRKPHAPGTMINKDCPTVLYNAMIAPIAPYSLRGFIWYQGESDTPKAQQYRRLFPALIRNWRNTWHQNKLPFYYVQIAPFEYGHPFVAAWLRQAQLETLALPNTGMAVTIDIGNPVDIHPRNKQEVARRLALWALAETYGREHITYSGPIYDKIKIEGNRIRVFFDHVNGGLMTKDGKLTGFEIAAANGKFVTAEARIDADTVLVHSKPVSDPAAVRYAWANAPKASLFNKAGLPASPFNSRAASRLPDSP